MCIIAAWRAADSGPTPEQVARCGEVNRDGFGLMFTTRRHGVGIVKPIFDYDSIPAALAEARRSAASDGWIVAHWRIATSGKKDRTNTHPHKLWTGAALVHNGILPGMGTDTFSDTVELTRTLRKCGRSVLQLPLQRMIGNNNKIVVLDGALLYLYNEGAGTWEGGADAGVWYSNSGYRPAPPPMDVSYHSWKGDLPARVRLYNREHAHDEYLWKGEHTNEHWRRERIEEYTGLEPKTKKEKARKSFWKK